MKVVLFCGGLGMRIREAGDVPKPMVTIGYRPILWHVMKYYAHYGHKDFILCLGYKADVIKQFFLQYEEWVSNDFTLSKGGKQLTLENNDIEDWNITFVDTGLNSNIGQRLSAVRRYVENEEMFLANYSDGLTDAPLPAMIDLLRSSGKTGCFLAVRPPLTFHLVEFDTAGEVQRLRASQDSDIWMNAGYFVFRSKIFNYINEGEELVVEPFQRLIAEGELIAYRHEGFFRAMDTLRDKQTLEDMVQRGDMPWQPKLARQAEVEKAK